MLKKLIRLAAIVMSVVMIVGLFSACGASTAGGPSGSSPSTPTQNQIAGIDSNVDVSAYAGTTVKYVTWKDPEQNEDKTAVEAFEKKYNINLEVLLVNQSGYVNTIASQIASGTQGDVFFENGQFPGSLTVMQPLDAAMLDLEDPIWNKALIKASTLDGHPYLVDAISNIWTEVDICVYNKSLFAQANIPTPVQFYEQGKWTFENFRWCAQEISKLGKEYVGAGLLGDATLGAAGCAFFSYKDNQIHLSVDDHLTDVMSFLAQLKVDNIAKFDRSGFGDGKQGMAITNCFGLKRTGYFSKINPDHIGATYMPKWNEESKHTVTGIYRGWGLIDGAKNPVGAGLFLREYLDVNNYDMSDTFHNDDVSNFFFQVTGTYSEDMIHYLSLRSATGMGEAFENAWDKVTPANMQSYIDSQMNTMKAMCKKANEIIEEERAWIKQAEANGQIKKANK